MSDDGPLPGFHAGTKSAFRTGVGLAPYRRQPRQRIRGARPPPHTPRRAVRRSLGGTISVARSASADAGDLQRPRVRRRAGRRRGGGVARLRTRWFAGEHTVLAPTVGHAVRTGRDSHAWQLAWVIAPPCHARALGLHQNLPIYLEIDPSDEDVNRVRARRADERRGLRHQTVGAMSTGEAGVDEETCCRWPLIRTVDRR